MEQRSFTKYKGHLFNWMTLHGVAQIEMHFDGGGDSGTITDVNYLSASGVDLRGSLGLPGGDTGASVADYNGPHFLCVACVETVYSGAHGGPVDKVTHPTTSVPYAAELIFYHVTDQWDWVNNEGGYGTVTFHLLADEATDDKPRGIVVDMNVREMTSVNHTGIF